MKESRLYPINKIFCSKTSVKNERFCETYPAEDRGLFLVINKYALRYSFFHDCGELFDIQIDRINIVSVFKLSIYGMFP